eukprot:TRINITY_DN1957_c0_g2_i1.p1 TRINITY_DN1957_c0_g2~~TRINITY_DN1957_c0_g2_i1.p1  ORF type:complete len:164 (+),score=12.15 TRINITY_DN1957_c0_g2_i1:131-622(+)
MLLQFAVSVVNQVQVWQHYKQTVRQAAEPWELREYSSMKCSRLLRRLGKHQSFWLRGEGPQRDQKQYGSSCGCSKCTIVQRGQEVAEANSTQDFLIGERWAVYSSYVRPIKVLKEISTSECGSNQVVIMFFQITQYLFIQLFSLLFSNQNVIVQYYCQYKLSC